MQPRLSPIDTLAAMVGGDDYSDEKRNDIDMLDDDDRELDELDDIYPPMSPSRRGAIVELSPKQNRNKAVKRKVMELGCNWGGKTSLFKAAKLAYHNGFSDNDRSGFRDVIYSNILYSMRLLMENALQDADTSKDEKNYIKTFGYEILHMFADFSIEKAALQKVPDLWAQESLKRAYTRRNTTFHIPEVQHWLNDTQRIFSDDYIPDDQDILFCRVKTTGIVYNNFDFQKYDVELIDVGSERNERKKWYSCFEGVTDLVYVVGLDEFDMLCYEDNETNRLIESLNTWIEVLKNNNYFPASKVNLFLVFNKIDLFEQKIKNGACLSKSFPAYQPKQMGFDPSQEFKRALQYIANRFLSSLPDKRETTVCVTKAVDMESSVRFWNSLLSTPLRSERLVDSKPPTPFTLGGPASIQEAIPINIVWWWDDAYPEESQDHLLNLALETPTKPKSYIMTGSPKVSSKPPSPVRTFTPSPSEQSPSKFRGLFGGSPILYEPNKKSNFLSRKNGVTSYPVRFLDTVERFPSIVNSDLTLSCKESPQLLLKVHSYILSVHCPLLLAYIKDQQVNNQNVTIIPEVTAITLLHMISFIYSKEPYPYFTSSQSSKARESKQLSDLNNKFQFATAADLKKNKKSLFGMPSPINFLSGFNSKNKTITNDQRNRSNSLPINDQILMPPPPSPTGKKNFINKLKSTLSVRRSSFITEISTAPPFASTSESISEDHHRQSSSSSLTNSSTFGNLTSGDLHCTSVANTLVEQNVSKLIGSDLIVKGVGWQAGCLHLHRFVMETYLPGIRSDSCHYNMLPFYKFKSYLCVIAALYGGDLSVMCDKTFDTQNGICDFSDLIEMIQICRIWDLDRNFTLFTILCNKLNDRLTPTNALVALLHFENDFIDLGKFLPSEFKRRDFIPATVLKMVNKKFNLPDSPTGNVEESGKGVPVNVTYPGTYFSVLPVEILFHIFTYLASPLPSRVCVDVPKRLSIAFTMGEEKPKFVIPPREEMAIAEEDYYYMLNQDSLIFMLHCNIDFIHYLNKNYKDYLVLRQNGFKNFNVVRNHCFSYLSKCVSVIQDMQEYKVLSAKSKNRINELAFEMEE
ncbi:guanine nucleotide-binding protein alpha-2 subunit [Acrasis kona]|uniref:Guanine nucleotide-binding protein alpha-2 subunit n=1 Tax=Acrasis kona TaxID=1008807 RepID=A0AAW2ZP91_9EUKA